MAELQMGKSVTNRILTGDHVVTTVDMHGAEVAATLRELFAELNAVELNASQVEPFIKTLAALLHAATRDLEAKEREYIAEVADDAEPRAIRDENANAGVEVMQRAKELVASALGEEGLDTYKLRAPLTRVPRDVAARLEATIALLEKNPAHGADALGTVFDSAKVAEKLGEVHQPLQEALDTVAREEQERQQAINARDEATDAWSSIYQGSATALVGLCRLAGREDLVELLRPTAAHVAGRAEPPSAD